jgi:hypothetical protein
MKGVKAEGVNKPLRYICASNTLVGDNYLWQRQLERQLHVQNSICLIWGTAVQMVQKVADAKWALGLWRL